MVRFFQRDDPFSDPDALTSPYRLEDSKDRYLWFLRRLNRASLMRTEFLLDKIEVDVPNTLPRPMVPGRTVDPATRAQLVSDVKRLHPWGYTIELAEGIRTGNPKHLEKQIYRTHLVMNGIRAVLGEKALAGASVLDMASNHGFFSLACKEAGASTVTGYDLRKRNVEKGEYLRDYFGIGGVTFGIKNVYDVEGEYDVVLNLGLLYHVTDPYRLIDKSYKLARRIAVIDTVTHRSPVSTFVVRTNKDVGRPGNGEFDVELQPTYRGLIDLMLAVGFNRIVEIVPREATDRARHPLYENGNRRCLIGIKEPAARVAAPA